MMVKHRRLCLFLYIILYLDKILFLTQTFPSNTNIGLYFQQPLSCLSPHGLVEDDFLSEEFISSEPISIYKRVIYPTRKQELHLNIHDHVFFMADGLKCSFRRRLIETLIQSVKHISESILICIIKCMVENIIYTLRVGLSK